MADYIYLLQNRLSPAQRTAVEAVRNAARTQGLPVFLVGGAVRDLTTGAPVRDLDFALQGEVEPLLADLEAAGGTIAGENPTLSSTFLLFRGGVRVEIGPTQTVVYPKPGQPETKTASILDDLRRRDFTVNAMAISLNEGSYGLLLDPLNGVADAENRELRLSSNYGFIEQPALLFRAARLSERLGWSLEEKTQSRYETAKEEGYVSALPAWDRGYELEEVFHEEDPIGIWEQLQSEGWSEALFPALKADVAEVEGLERVRDLAGQMEQLGIHTDASPVLFPLLVAKLPTPDAQALKALFPRRGFREQIDSLESRGKELATQLTSKAAAVPSDAWKLLFAAEPEVVLWTAANSRTPAVQSKLKNFLNEWPQMRQRIPYALMQEMRITPELPGYAQLVNDLFFALIDGKLPNAEATRAFLEPFSPPAPVVQAAPRRKAAKGTRGRSRKAQEQALAEPEDDEDVPSDRDEEEDEDNAAETDTDEPHDADEEEDEDDEEETSAPVIAAKPAPQAPREKASKATAATGLDSPAEGASAPKVSAEKATNDATSSKIAPAKQPTPAKAAGSKVSPSKSSVPLPSETKSPVSAPKKSEVAKNMPVPVKVAVKAAAAASGNLAAKSAAKKSEAPQAQAPPASKKTSAKPIVSTAKPALRTAVPVKPVIAKAPAKKLAAKQAPVTPPAAKKAVPAKKVVGKGSKR